MEIKITSSNMILYIEILSINSSSKNILELKLRSILFLYTKNDDPKMKLRK